MRTLLAAPIVAASFLASSATAQSPPCPISGIQTTPFGNPQGFGGNHVFELGWDASSCSLTMKVEQDPCCFIGNYYLTGAFLMYGDAIFFQPVVLPPPFYGHPLYILPIDVLGPLPAGTTSIPVPPDPALVGRTFQFQAIAQFLFTLGGPMGTIDYVLTHGITGTFN